MLHPRWAIRWHPKPRLLPLQGQSQFARPHGWRMRERFVEPFPRCTLSTITVSASLRNGGRSRQVVRPAFETSDLKRDSDTRSRASLWLSVASLLMAPLSFASLPAVENENHCDFVKLREMLIRVNMEDLREQTHTRHYELYRRCKLEEMGFKDTDPDSKPFRYEHTQQTGVSDSGWVVDQLVHHRQSCGAEALVAQ